jgi:NADH-quinone oxidoreductase subunit L
METQATLLSTAWLWPALPLAGFVVLALAGRRLGDRLTAWIGAGSVGLSAAVSLGALLEVLIGGRAAPGTRQVLWRWMEVGDLTVEIGLWVDPLSLAMAAMVAGVGFLIHLYSAEFMERDEGYARFFASMNLFVASMLILVLADDLLLLYLGWEGVGLCSYLLIGFWYQDPANGRAARKAFVVTRVGDAAMAVALFILVTELGTLRIAEVMDRAEGLWAAGSALPVACAALLLAGAVGKSAQLPLQVWLPDAMAGPTPVSALIHAATMVTAGAYLIARTHALFVLAPAVLTILAILGAATLLVAGTSALAQKDIKRVLAYSTISQLGYMFLALGVGAWSAAIFHLLTHAFFKALLFLGAGVVILALHHEHDVTRMGGLRQRLPLTFWTFTIASASLAGLPLITAGFYSKDAILWKAYTSGAGGTWLWLAGLIGALITAVYIFRVVFLAFFGEAKTEPDRRPRWRIGVPLVVLAGLALVAGFVEMPATLGGVHAFSDFMEPSFTAHPAEPAHATGGHDVGTEALLQLVAALASLGGIGLAWWWFGRRRLAARQLLSAPGERFLASGWGFDAVYHALIVRPFVRAAELNRDDVIDLPFRAAARVAQAAHELGSRGQSGRLRAYTAAIAVGVVVLLALAVVL